MRWDYYLNNSVIKVHVTLCFKGVKTASSSAFCDICTAAYEDGNVPLPLMPLPHITSNLLLRFSREPKNIKLCIMKHIQKYYFLTSVGSISLTYAVTISSNILQSVQYYFKYFLKSYERHFLSNILGCSGRRGGGNGMALGGHNHGPGGGLGWGYVMLPPLG